MALGLLRNKIKLRFFQKIGFFNEASVSKKSDFFGLSWPEVLRDRIFNGASIWLGFGAVLFCNNRQGKAIILNDY
jgi:hypothetical protein